MAELPVGTVTFMFTDIEASTRLLQELGDRFPPVLEEHGEILRRAITSGSGVVVGTEGDSFFAAFPSALEATSAAVRIQRDLSDHRWPPGVRVRVRVGLHTGEGVPAGDDYVGLDVNRAARIAAAGHGGQVLLSGATGSLVGGALPQGVAMRDLGEHRLKDIAGTERLHDLVIEGLPSEFPTPRTLDSRPNNLPNQLTSFVGRSREMAEVRGLVRGARLLTLTGAGGSGKTRLALEVAGSLLSEYRDGVFWVDLSSVTDAGLVPAAVASALNVPEVGGREIVDALRDHLREREVLVVVDNFEQVVEARSVIEQLLVSSPDLTVLVTSRVILGIPGEREYEVPPLDPPDPSTPLPVLRRAEAVRLFTERARAANPSFRLTEGNAVAVAEITTRLDGLPLGIELAATRTKVLSPDQIRSRLDRRLSVLSSSVHSLPDRQRTLHGAIAWSHDLLEEDERALFAGLSIFHGGWTLEAAEAVCGPAGPDVLDGLASLVDKSLVRRAEMNGDEPRFYMLETIRDFASERLLESGDLEEVARRHARYFLDLAVEAEPHLTGGDQAAWLARCEREHPNLRAAMERARADGDVSAALRAAAALWRFWQQRGHLAEGRDRLEEVLALSEEPTRERARALIAAGGIAWWQTDRAATRRFYSEAVDIGRALGDPASLAEALYNQAFVVATEEGIEAAARLLEESRDLYRAAGDEAGVAQALVMLVIRDAQAGSWEAVRAGLEEGVDISRRLGQRYHLANNLVWLAIAHERLGRSEDAHSAALEALDLFREVDNPTGTALAFVCLAFLATWGGRHEDAIKLMAASEALDERVGAGRTEGFAGLLEGDPLSEARSQLPAEVADAAWDEGRSMTEEEAVAFARRTS